MAMTFANTMLVIPFVLLIVLLPLALAVVLQVWLCKKGPRLGLILPGLSLLLTVLVSLTMLLNITYSYGGSLQVSYVDEAGQTVIVEEEEIQPQQTQPPVRAMAVVGVVFLLGNIPTVIFLGIWLRARNQRIKKDDLKRMSIEDLE